MKHYGKHLPDANRNVKEKSEDIELLYLRKSNIEIKLSNLNKEIEQAEKEFLEYILTDWSEDEINEAKNKLN